MKSKFLTLDLADFGKGLLITVFTAVITFLYEMLQAGTLIFDLALLKTIGLTALSAGLAYILKNLFSNSQGEVFKAEPK
jgi:hypothetical protein